MLLKTLIATLCVIGATVAEHSPVFLWGLNSAPHPALKTVSQGDFEAIVTGLLKDNMIVAFEEDTLANSDFTCSNAKSADSCYAHLKGVSAKTYYANVENPGVALVSVPATREFVKVDKTGKFETPITCEKGKIVIVRFEKMDADRSIALEEHDAAISAISNTVACPTAFLYTATPSNAAPARKRARRDTVLSSNGTYFRHGSQFLIYYKSLSVRNGANVQNLTVSSMTIKNNTDSSNSFNVVLTTTTKPLSFNITASGGYFSMSNVRYDNITFRALDINAPYSFSFMCGNQTFGGIPATGELTSPYSLIWTHLQLQAPFNATTNETFVFGDSWDCTGFFTPGILMGLFVTILLLVVTFIGICWMVDINTMDRFDDPKGKTITINASE